MQGQGYGTERRANKWCSVKQLCRAAPATSSLLIRGSLVRVQHPEPYERALAQMRGLFCMLSRASRLQRSSARQMPKPSKNC